MVKQQRITALFLGLCIATSAVTPVCAENSIPDQIKQSISKAVDVSLMIGGCIYEGVILPLVKNPRETATAGAYSTAAYSGLAKECVTQLVGSTLAGSAITGLFYSRAALALGKVLVNHSELHPTTWDKIISERKSDLAKYLTVGTLGYLATVATKNYCDSGIIPTVPTAIVACLASYLSGKLLYAVVEPTNN